MPLFFFFFFPQEAGRLLYIGQNEWTHVNCAIWSAEVFEENDGSLKNVHAAVARGRQMVSAWAQEGGQLSGVTGWYFLQCITITWTYPSIPLLVPRTFLVLGIKIRASHVLGKCFTTELYSQCPPHPLFFFFLET